MGKMNNLDILKRILAKKHNTADRFTFQLLSLFIAMLFILSGAFIIYYGIKWVLRKLEKWNTLRNTSKE